MKFAKWPLEVRIVAIAWVPAVVAAITSTFLLQSGAIQRTDDAYGLSMLAGFGLTTLLVFEFVTWAAHGVGFIEACVRSGSTEQFRAKMWGDLRRPQTIIAYAFLIALWFAASLGLRALAG